MRAVGECGSSAESDSDDNDNADDDGDDGENDDGDESDDEGDNHAVAPTEEAAYSLFFPLRLLFTPSAVSFDTAPIAADHSLARCSHSRMRRRHSSCVARSVASTPLRASTTMKRRTNDCHTCHARRIRRASERRNADANKTPNCRARV